MSCYQIAARYKLHFFGKELFICDSYNRYNYVKLNSVEKDIVLAINTFHNENAVWNELRNMYNISEEDREAYQYFRDFVNGLCKKEIAEIGTCDTFITGKENMSYPFSVSFELTNRCNFCCTHCYKCASSYNNQFIKTEDALNIISDLNENVCTLDITGGEATLHPDFNKIIECINIQKVSLLTNASTLYKIPTETLKHFNSIQISLYGISETDYKKYTGTDNFNNVCRGIRQVIEQKIDCWISLILRRDIIEKLDEYIEFLYVLGVRKVRFGISQKVGRMRDNINEWEIDNNSYDDFISKLDVLKIKYPEMYFMELEPEEGIYKKGRVSNTIQCYAGKKYITISEKGIVRPCVYLPEKYFGLYTWKDFLNNITNNIEGDFDKGIYKFCQNNNGGDSIQDICSKAFTEVITFDGK